MHVHNFFNNNNAAAVHFLLNAQNVPLPYEKLQPKSQRNKNKRKICENAREKQLTSGKMNEFNASIR